MKNESHFRTAELIVLMPHKVHKVSRLISAPRTDGATPLENHVIRNDFNASPRRRLIRSISSLCFTRRYLQMSRAHLASQVCKQKYIKYIYICMSMCVCVCCLPAINERDTSVIGARAIKSIL